MLSWHEPLFLGESVGEEEAGKLKKSCERGRVPAGTYLVTLAAEPGNRLDIWPGVLLFQRELKERLPCILGMAKGKREALDLAVKIEMEHDCSLPRM